MKTIISLFVMTLTFSLPRVTTAEEKTPQNALDEAVAKQQSVRLAELNEYWAKVSKAVGEGDFVSYQQSCHPLGVLVSGNKKMTQPLNDALARWKQEFVDTKSGAMSASVAFRFSRRIGDGTTAHESGIFRYAFQRKGEEQKVEYVRFEALLMKENGSWRILMENQQESAGEAEWNQLKGE
jgi:hypothetical protein